MRHLSESALALFRRHAEQGPLDVDASNHDCYRELEAAGLVVHRHPFTGSRLYGLTRAGAELKEETGKVKEAV